MITQSTLLATEKRIPIQSTFPFLLERVREVTIDYCHSVRGILLQLVVWLMSVALFVYNINSNNFTTNVVLSGACHDG